MMDIPLSIRVSKSIFILPRRLCPASPLVPNHPCPTHFSQCQHSPRSLEPGSDMHIRIWPYVNTSCCLKRRCEAVPSATHSTQSDYALTAVPSTPLYLIPGPLMDIPSITNWSKQALREGSGSRSGRGSGKCWLLPGPARSIHRTISHPRSQPGSHQRSL